jgi:hypothetical protein
MVDEVRIRERTRTDIKRVFPDADIILTPHEGLPL